MSLFREIRGRGVVTLASSILLISPALAQEAVTLSGRVTDETGGILSGARVEVVSAAGTKKTAATDGTGTYVVKGLSPGTYAVTVTKARFSPYANGGIALGAGRGAVLDVQLTVAPREEKVTVEEEDGGVSLDPQNSAGAIVLKGSDIDALPDDPDELAEALQALAGPSAGPSGGQIFVDGFGRGRVPPKDAIREIRINSNPFSAEYDRLGFGRIEILTKPGTDRLRGNVSFGFNDEVLNSRNPFAPNRPAFQRREWGGSLGGSLAQKKASFFVDFDRRDVDDNDLINATILDPSLEMVPFSLAVLTPQHRTTFSPRLDCQLNASNTIMLRYAYTDFQRLKAGIGEFSLQSRAFDTSNRQHTVQITETAVIKGKVVNETRLQFARERRDQVGDNSIPTLQVLDAFTGGGSQVGLAYNHEDRWELTNTTSWTHKNHSLRAGIRVRGVQIDDVSSQNFGGTVTFSGGVGPVLDENDSIVRDANGRPVMTTLTSLERYRRTILFQQRGFSPADVRASGGGATQYRIAGGDPQAQVEQWDVSPFIQDDWKVSRDFTVGLGLRYENQTNISSPLNFAPRIAFAWAPRKAASTQERPKTVFRGGFGIFYDRFEEGLTLQAERYDGVSQQQYLVTAPGMLDRIGFDYDHVYGLPSVETLASFAVPQTTRVVAPDLETPYTVQAGLSIERQLPKNFTFSAILVSSHMRRTLRTRNINAPLSATGERPLGRPGNVYQHESTGRFDQDQLILGLNNRVSRTFSLFVRYSLGRARSDADGVGSFPANQYDLSGEYGRASMDVRHRFFLGGSLTVPGGVRINPFVIVSSGRPFNITTGRDNNGDTLFTDRPAFATDPSKPGVVATKWGLLDPNPGPGQTMIPRNHGRSPGFLMVNLRLNKSFGFGKTAERPQGPEGGGAAGPGVGPRGPVPGGGGGGGRGPGGRGGLRGGEGVPGSRYNLTFSLSAQNVLNRVNRGAPVGNLSSPRFGQSTATAGGFGFGGGGGGGSAAGNRRIELQMRFGF